MWEMNYDPAIAMAFQGIEADVDLTSIWDAVACPILVIRGQESDLLTAEDAKTMTSKKSVQLVEIPDVGHAPALMSEDQIGMVRDFLVM
jgi:pimeloyl-ACP methyl ester carboxylesterase